MKKKFLAIFLVLIMVLGLMPATMLASEDEPDEPMGNISLLKFVDDEEEGLVEIAFWLMFMEELDADEVIDIFDDITFDIYYSNADGDDLGKVDGAIGKLESPYSSLITFADALGAPFAFASGWYLVVENLGDLAAKYFLEGDDLLFYFNAVSGLVTANETGFAKDTRFTVEQFFDNAYCRPVQAVFGNSDGTRFNLRNSPKLDIPGSPNGGGALDATKFVATDDKGNEYISFCADSGAVGVKGEFVIDESNRGFTDEQMKWLIAALDYIYAEYSFDEFEYEAVAQLIVWNMILKYSSGIAISDLWLRNVEKNGVFYKYYLDQYEEIIKIEAANYGNAAKFWADPDNANKIVIDILADPDYYLELYEDRVASGTERYVGDAVFLIGDPNSLTEKFKVMMYEDLNIYQQRQLIITFNDPAAFVNPPNDVEKVGNINIIKMVDDDGKLLIGAWLLDVKELTPAEIEEILADITFKIYYSNAAGDEIAEVVGVTGKIEGALTSVITFTDEYDISYDFPSGWYLVREELGPVASEYFKQVPDLHFYFNAIPTPGVLIAPPKEFAPGTTFTIDQNWEKENTRPVQALFEDADGNIRELRLVPKLDIPNSPNGGGAMNVNKFIATDDKGNDYISFCADNGAVGVEGKYVVDESNQGLSDEEMLWLTAAMDYIYAEYSFTDFENVAIAQLIVWNMLLEYSDGIALSNLWLDGDGLGPYKYYTDHYGELIKIEAANYNNGAQLWGDPVAVNGLVNAILANPVYYLNRYNTRVNAGADDFIQQAVFLKGDPDTLEEKRAGMDYQGLNIYQQRQLILVPNEPVTFDNEPQPAERVALISLLKNVNGTETYPIAFWMMFEGGFEFDEIEEILAEITFEIYYSNAAGDDLGQVIGVTGKITDVFTSIISFFDSAGMHEFESGWYIVHEVMGDKAKAVFKDDIPDLLFYFDAVAELTLLGPDTDEVATFDNEPLPLGGLTISASAILKTSEGEYTEFWQGERTPYEYYSRTSSYGSVTATNVGDPHIVPNSNHFCYAILNRVALAEGIELDLVVGNGLSKVGKAFVQLVDGKIVITFLNLDSATFGALASATPFNPSNGNIHSGNEFKHNNVSVIDCPAGDVIYLYIHCDPIRFKINITHTMPGYDPETGYVWVETPPVWKYTEYGDPVEKTTSLDVFVKVYDPDGELVASFTLNGNKATTGAKTLSDLPAGEYTINWTFDYAGDDTIYDGKIEVKAGETVKFPHISNSYTENTKWTEAEDSPIILPPIINPVVIVGATYD